ncbi:MAG: bifunctional oligoribonuclease/PAP phosphatase NrnA [Candidatus Metalachnospira sp.]|nr:bifunctional oligoribonuclease/PAP phosphatase NrnA [Candidatus Metalachnospira sp.]
MNNSFEEIRELIDDSQSIAIAGHVSPDGDAVGSSCALAMALIKKGKKVKLFLEDIQQKLKNVPYSQNIIHDEPEDEFDLFISLDCGDEQRLGNVSKLIKTTYTINIDHHVSNTYFGKMNYVDGDASSTCELVYQLLYGWCDLDKNIAYALYTGILFDTGCFKHSSTSPYTMQIAGELMTYNIPFTQIQEQLFYSRSMVEVKLLSAALKNIKFACGGRVTHSKLSIEEINSCGGSSKDVDSIISFIKNIDGVDAAVFFYEKSEGEIKASMRSNETVNVCEIAQKFGGGGHVRASGCTLYGSFEEMIPKITDELISALEV